MNVFEPLRTYSSPRRSAVVLRRATSEPASGSERPNEQRIGSSRSGGSHLAFCSSLPAMITGPAPRPFAPSDVPMPVQPQFSSSPTSMPSNAPSPRPPYSTGMCRFISPSPCAFAITSAGCCIATSYSAALGRISFAANSRASARNSFCSSVRANETPPWTASSIVAIVSSRVLIDWSVNKRSERRRLGQEREPAAREREADGEDRPLLRRRVDLDRAAALADDPVHRREAEAGALTDALCGEEWLEDPVARLGWHAGAVVDHREHGLVAVREDDNDQQTAAGHRVPGVDRQVHHDLLELRRIGADDHGLRAEDRLEPDVLADQASQQAVHPLDDVTQVDVVGLERLAPAERKQLAGQVACPDRGVADGGHLLPAGVASVELALQQVAVADHRRHQVVEVVRDAAGELADGLHLLRLAQLLLELMAAADVFDQADTDAVVDVERDVHVRVERRAVLAHVALVDRERVALRIVELVLHGERPVVRVRDVGVVHPRELLALVAEHALERRVRLAHDPVAPDGDPDRRALEDEAEPLLRVLCGGGRPLELADQAGDAVDDEERCACSGPGERIDVHVSLERLLHDRGHRDAEDGEPEQDHAAERCAARPR